LHLFAVQQIGNGQDVANIVIRKAQVEQRGGLPALQRAQPCRVIQPIRIGQAGLRPVPKDAQADLPMGVDLRPHQISAHSVHPALRQVTEGNVLTIRVEHRDHLIRAVVSPLGGEAAKAADRLILPNQPPAQVVFPIGFATGICHAGIVARMTVFIKKLNYLHFSSLLVLPFIATRYKKCSPLL